MAKLKVISLTNCFLEYRLPVLFNSFLSAVDIISDRENGFLTKPFDVDAYITKLSELIFNYNKLSTSL